MLKEKRGEKNWRMMRFLFKEFLGIERSRGIPEGVLTSNSQVDSNRGMRVGVAEQEGPRYYRGDTSGKIYNFGMGTSEPVHVPNILMLGGVEERRRVIEEAFGA